MFHFDSLLFQGTIPIFNTFQYILNPRLNPTIQLDLFKYILLIFSLFIYIIFNLVILNKIHELRKIKNTDTLKRFFMARDGIGHIRTTFM